MTSISDLPDFSDDDIEKLGLRNIPNKIVIEKDANLTPSKFKDIINEDNLLVGLIILLILYKPTNTFINSMVSPFSNDLVNIVFKSLCILTIYILIKKYILPIITL